MNEECTSSNGGAGRPVFGVDLGALWGLDAEAVEEPALTGVVRADGPPTDPGGKPAGAPISCRGVTPFIMLPVELGSVFGPGPLGVA